jgi:hypothetical protein
MATIKIDRKKYKHTKNQRSWLDGWIETQVKVAGSVTRNIKGKDVTSMVFKIDPVKMFELIRANGLDFPGVEKQVQEGQNGAPGRARMIFSGVIKRKIRDGAEIFNADGSKVDRESESFVAYRATLGQPKVAASTEGAVQDVGEQPVEAPVSEDTAA